MRVSDSDSGLKMSKCCQRNLRSKCDSTRNDRNPSPTQKKGRGRDAADLAMGQGMQMGQQGRLFGNCSFWFGELRLGPTIPRVRMGWERRARAPLPARDGGDSSVLALPVPPAAGLPDPSQLLGTSSPFVMGEAE